MERESKRSDMKRTDKDQCSEEKGKKASLGLQDFPGQILNQQKP